MSSVGPVSPGTCADDSAVGTITWSNVNNAKASDNNYAQATNGAYAIVYTHYLKCTNFDFSTIPAGSTIDGIKVEIEKVEVGSGEDSIKDSIVKLVVGGSVVGSNYAKTTTAWPSSDTVVSYGGATDKWGLTPGPSLAQIQASNFGIVISAKIPEATPLLAARIDHVKITVYYTAAAAPAGWITLFEDGE